MGWMAYRKWKEAKQLPGTAGPGNMVGCCLISFHFLGAIHPIRPVVKKGTSLLILSGLEIDCLSLNLVSSLPFLVFPVY